MSLVAYVRGYKAPGEVPERLHLVGTGKQGPVALAARAIVGGKVDAAVVEVSGFRFEDITSYRDSMFLPGIVKYGDVQALAALNAPHRLTIVDSGNDWDVVKSAFKASNGKLQFKSELSEAWDLK